MSESAQWPRNEADLGADSPVADASAQGGSPREYPDRSVVGSGMPDQALAGDPSRPSTRESELPERSEQPVEPRVEGVENVSEQSAIVTVRDVDEHSVRYLIPRWSLWELGERAMKNATNGNGKNGSH